MLNPSHVRAEEEWPCRFDSGKGSYPCAIIKQLPLTEFEQQIIPCDDYETTNLSIYEPGNSKVKYIGELNGKKIYDIVHFLKPNEYYDFYQLTLIEADKDLYRPVHCVIQSSSIISPVDSKVISQQNLLANEAKVSGSGGYYNLFYLYYPSGLKAPNILNLDDIYASLKNILPKEYNLAGGKCFEAETLSWHSAAYAKGDPTCCPSGGVIDAKYVITSEGKLKLESSKYTPIKN